MGLGLGPRVAGVFGKLQRSAGELRRQLGLVPAVVEKAQVGVEPGELSRGDVSGPLHRFQR